MLGSFTLRRMRSAWLLVACLAGTVLVTTALVAALVQFYVSALPATVSSELVQSGPAMSIAINGESGGPPGAQTAAVAARLTTALGRVPYRLYAATWSNALALPGTRHSGQTPVLEAATVGGITANATLTSGRWPAAGQPGGPIPVALPATAARDLGLHAGSVLTVRDLNSNRRIQLQVSGLYRPARPAAAYWQLDTVGPAGVAVAGGFASYGPAVVAPAAFTAPGGGLVASQVSFVALPRVASITAADLTPLAARVDAVVGTLDNAGQLTANTTMPQTLAGVAAGLAAAKSLVVISGLQLLLLTAAALALASRLLASYREGETALLAARGAARRQLVGPSVAEAVLTVVVSAAAGVVVGSWLSAALLGHLTRQPLRVAAPGTTMWLAGAILVVLCLGIVLWPAARPAQPGEARTRRGRSAQVAVALAAGADIALIVLAILAVRELLTYSAARQTAAGIDPVIVVAPVLALAGLAVIPLRLLPVAARGLDRLSARGTRFGSAMANWAISRRPVRQSGPALLLILTVGASTVALAQYQSWRASVREQAAFAAGAQVRVQPPQPVPLAGTRGIAGLPGVRAAMPVSEVAQTGPGQLLVLDARLAARTVTLPAGLSSLPENQLFRAISPRSRPGLVLPGHPIRLAVTASLASNGDAARLGPVSATLVVQDADGVAYTVLTSTIPADGKPHQLVADLGHAGAAYPLRLIGLSVSYSMPPYPLSAAAAVAGGHAVLRVDGLSASPTATGPLPPPAVPGRALGLWSMQLEQPGLAGEIGLLGGDTDGSESVNVDNDGPVGDAEQVSFDPGHGPLIPQSVLIPGGALGISTDPRPGPAEVDFDIPAASTPVSVIATSGFAVANGIHDGSVFTATVAGQQIGCKLVAIVANFPDGGTLVADQTAVQDALASKGFGGALPVTDWWLSTVSGHVPPGLPAGSVVTDAASLALRLGSNPLSAAPAQAAAAVAAAAALVAALGFCVSVAASARERRTQSALLSALGVPAASQASLFCLEEALISVPAAAVGLAIGVGLANLLVPALTVTALAGLPALPVIVTLPAGWVVAIAAGLPAITVVAAAVAALRRPDPAADLRAAEAVA